MASDSGDTDEASVDLTETKVNVDNVDTPKFSMRGYSTNWGPVGFRKKLHPLSIMVSFSQTVDDDDVVWYVHRFNMIVLTS